MASSSIIAGQTEGEKVEVVTDFLFLGSKITADGDCSHEVRRWLLLGMKAVTNLDSVSKSRDITLLTKVRIVKAMVFPVVTYSCKSWTVKKMECWKIDAFELWCWRRLMRVPWTARRSNQSILREITLNTHWKDWYWSWSSGILVIWWEKLTHWKSPLMLGKEGRRAEREEGVRGWDGWMASPMQWTWPWANFRR